LIIELGGPSDGTSPTPPGDLRTTDVQATAISLRWDAATDPGGSGVVGYDLYRPDGSLRAALGLVTTYVDTTVLPETTYAYVVRARDAAGNVSDPSNTLNVTTLGLPADGTPPTPPGDLRATDVQATSVTLRWDAATDPGGSGVVGYDLYRPDGSLLVALGLVTTYQDTTVAPATAYAYVVKARDLAGNVSDPSNTLNLTTPAIPSTLDFIPTDDASIKESKPTRNYGADPDLWVDGSSVKQTLLRFNITGVGTAPITRVRLRLFVTDSSSTGGDVFAALGSGWSEDTVTWATAPGIGAFFGALGPAVVGTWVELDVTGLVTGDGPVSLRITSTNSNGADYASTEHPTGFAPELIVDLG
jgi:chitodextrinase